MDLIKDATKNINLYDVKAYVRKAQNVAMNLTEMEAKVREATNNEPWGAPSTLMNQIASGTYNYREREEIVSFIFRRFTEKAANEWRQIYKSLQLLDYLIRNGSERIIDDVRANLSLIQMLKSFHYIDSKGRDQGINVRNRAKNLIGLLNDDAQIRTERKKARSNSKKFGGVSSAAFGGASSITTGPGLDDGDFTNRVFGDGGVYGARYGDSADEYNRNNGSGSGSGAGTGTSSSENFEEYNVEGTRRSKPTTATTTSSASQSKPQPQEPDLLADLDFGSSQPATKAAPAAATEDFDDDDEFDDFQSAPVTNGNGQGSNINNLSSLYQSQPQQQQPQQFQQQFQPQFQQAPSFNNSTSFNSSTTPSVHKVASSKNNDAFSSLFTSAKSKTGSRTASGTGSTTAAATASAPVQDDFFSDFTNNTTQKTTPNTTTSSNTNNNSTNSNGEIDLLSF